MDPNAILQTIREIVSIGTDRPLTSDETDVLVTSVSTLDEWITRGGFLPTAWNASHPPF